MSAFFCRSVWTFCSHTRRAHREGTIVDDAADGPRSVSRAILSNRGLTPHRSKSVRNPRVKKRQRYEQAKKKVSSQKAVFKGGLAGSKGVYEGEHSGVSAVRLEQQIRLHVECS